MFAPWRLAIRKAQHALKRGQLEHACRIVTAPNVQSFRQARDLRGQVVKALVRRARQHLGQGDSHRAWQDLLQAEQLETANAQLAELRHQLVNQGVSEAAGYLAGGQPDTALACLEQLRQRGVTTAECRRLRQAAFSWQAGQEQARLGHFAQAVENYEAAQRALGDCHALELGLDQAKAALDRAAGLEAELLKAVAGSNWEAALKHADSLLALAPEHTAAKAARRRAWQAVGVAASHVRPAPAARGVEPTVIKMAGIDAQLPEPSQAPDSASQPAARLRLWVDGVGGYLVCLGQRISIGQPGSRHVDVPVMADLSRLHAWIERDGEGYLLHAVRRSCVNGREVTGKSALAGGDRLELGGARLRFCRPSPLSATARLELLAPHRLAIAADAVLLMAETCIIGPRATSHVVAPNWRQEVVLYRQDDELWCRAPGEYEVDGQPCRHHARLSANSRIRGEGFSLAVEPIVRV